MSTNYPIHDLYIRELEYREIGDLKRYSLLRYDDHLLRQFGGAEFIRAGAGVSISPQIHVSADEVWTLIEGTVSFSWKDMRKNSPTYNAEHRIMSEVPLLVLVPFGVAFGYQVEENEALFVRFTTNNSLNSRQDEPSMSKRTI
jgi:dTDP-4-dehydrorhamnose 3,5-epimerase-like enzyme